MIDSPDPPSSDSDTNICVQYLLCSKSLNHFKFCWWYFPFFLFSACNNYEWNFTSLCFRHCHLVE